MKRTIALAVGLLVGAMWLAAPAHATPVPAPTPTVTPTATAPTATAPADPCALPTPEATLEEVPQAKGPALLDMRKRPKLPLPVECFVEFVDTCDGTQVTLHNPITRIAIKYRVDGEEGTHTVGPGETEGPIFVPKSESPFGVFIVVSDDEDSRKFLVTLHRWHEPDCQTATPTPTPVPTPAVTSQEPQLPTTGQNLAGEMWLAGGSAAALLAIGVGWLVVCRRRSAA